MDNSKEPRTDDLSEDNLLSLVCQFANVEKAVAGEELSQKEREQPPQWIYWMHGYF